MKYIIIMIFVLVVMEQNSYAELNELIMKNIKQSTDTYEQAVKNDKETTEIPRLWIHVRNHSQGKIIQEASSWLKNIKLGERNIDFRPVQFVNVGPSESQLRFFMSRDMTEAEQLFNKLKLALPHLQLKDFSQQNKFGDWLKPGHYELWLAPDVNSFIIQDGQESGEHGNQIQ